MSVVELTNLRVGLQKFFEFVAPLKIHLIKRYEKRITCNCLLMLKSHVPELTRTLFKIIQQNSKILKCKSTNPTSKISTAGPFSKCIFRQEHFRYLETFNISRTIISHRLPLNLFSLFCFKIFINLLFEYREQSYDAGSSGMFKYHSLAHIMFQCICPLEESI